MTDDVWVRIDKRVCSSLWVELSYSDKFWYTFRSVIFYLCISFNANAYRVFAVLFPCHEVLSLTDYILCMCGNVWKWWSSVIWHGYLVHYADLGLWEAGARLGLSWHSVRLVWIVKRRYTRCWTAPYTSLVGGSIGGGSKVVLGLLATELFQIGVGEFFQQKKTNARFKKLYWAIKRIIPVVYRY